MEEPLEVEVLFSPGKRYPEPIQVFWRGAWEKVEKIHLVHERWQAGILHLVYSLSLGGIWLSVRFDPQRARWVLEEIHPLSEP